MLHEECRLSRRGAAAHLAALLGVPVLEVRALAVLYTFRRDLESAAASAAAAAAAAAAESARPRPARAPGPAPPLPRSMPVSYSALAHVFAGRSRSRMRSAVACLVRRGLALKCGREHACITDGALERLSEFDEQIRSIEGR